MDRCVRIPAKIYSIQIFFEDLLFVVLYFLHERQYAFANFSGVGWFGVQKRILYQLLSNPTATLNNFSRFTIFPKCSNHSTWIDADMVKKPSIFDGDYRVNKMCRNLIKIYP